jgi:hypothetical protein
MNRTYVYPRFDPLVLVASIIGIFVCAMLAKGFLADALGSQEFLYRLITAIIGLLFLFCTVWILIVNLMNLAGVRKVITHDENLSVQNISSVRTIKWEEITEFGTYTVGFGHHRNRRYYLKAREYGDKRIDVCTQYLENVKDLIDTVFLRATNAKFVIVENVAWIPFTKQIQLVTWERRDHSFL